MHPVVHTRCMDEDDHRHRDVRVPRRGRPSQDQQLQVRQRPSVGMRREATCSWSQTAATLGQAMKKCRTSSRTPGQARQWAPCCTPKRAIGGGPSGGRRLWSILKATSASSAAMRGHQRRPHATGQGSSENLEITFARWRGVYEHRVDACCGGGQEGGWLHCFVPSLDSKSWALDGGMEKEEKKYA